MSDERLRELERLAASGSPEDKKRLRAEQERLGLRRTYPPRRHVPPRERAGVAFDAWCPVCRRWSIRRASQKERSRRRGGDRSPIKECRTDNLSGGLLTGSIRFGRVKKGQRFHLDGVLYEKTGKKQGVRVENVFSVSPPPNNPETRREFSHDDVVTAVSTRRCPGPARGQPCRPPLHALEDRLRYFEAQRLEQGCNRYGQKVEWFKHWIEVERKRRAFQEIRDSG